SLSSPSRQGSASQPPTESCMRLALRRRRRAPTSAGEPFVIEVVTPRTNAAALTSAENLFASLAPAEPISVEMAADSDRRRFLVRGSSAHMRQQVVSQLSAAYPQADLRPVAAEEDPAHALDDE